MSAETTTTAAAADPALETDGLTVSYGRTRVIEGLTLAVPRGSVYALLGRNGAGKSSLLRVLLGQRPAAAGRVRLLGEDPWTRRTSLMARVGVVPEEPDAPPEMTPAQLSSFCARLHARWNAPAVAERLRRFEVPADRLFGRLSKATRRSCSSSTIPLSVSTSSPATPSSRR
jgi:ABC-2 type transport system ATP-binding protein